MSSNLISNNAAPDMSLAYLYGKLSIEGSGARKSYPNFGLVAVNQVSKQEYIVPFNGADNGNLPVAIFIPPGKYRFQAYIMAFKDGAYPRRKPVETTGDFEVIAGHAHYIGDITVKGAIMPRIGLTARVLKVEDNYEASSAAFDLNFPNLAKLKRLNGFALDISATEKYRYSGDRVTLYPDRMY